MIYKLINEQLQVINNKIYIIKSFIILVGGGPIPIQPRPTTNVNNSNAVIFVESDEEQNGDTIPK
jgi:hypothetical protein